MSERWLITGASGQLGGHVLRLLDADQSDLELLAICGTRPCPAPRGRSVQLDLASEQSLSTLANGFRPTHILHIGGMTAVAGCFANPELARRINVDATRRLGEIARDHDSRLIYTSTDMVFSGEEAPYDEGAPPRPLSVYGHTKREGELTLADAAHTLIVRLPLMVGRPVFPRPSTFESQLEAMRSGQPLRLFEDEWRTPLSLAAAARALIGLARMDLTGIIHVPGPERLSRYEIIERVARLLGVRAKLQGVSRLSIESPEPRPRDLSLAGERLRGVAPHLTPGPIQREDVQ